MLDTNLDFGSMDDSQFSAHLSGGTPETQESTMIEQNIQRLSKAASNNLPNVNFGRNSEGHTNMSGAAYVKNTSKITEKKASFNAKTGERIGITTNVDKASAFDNAKLNLTTTFGIKDAIYRLNEEGKKGVIAAVNGDTVSTKHVDVSQLHENFNDLTQRRQDEVIKFLGNHYI